MLFCDHCKEWRSGKFWSRTQKNVQKAVFTSSTCQFNCCKECSETYNIDGQLASSGASDEVRRQNQMNTEAKAHKKAWRDACYIADQEQWAPGMKRSNRPTGCCTEVHEVDGLGVTFIFCSYVGSKEDAKLPPADTVLLQDPTEAEIQNSISLIQSFERARMENVLQIIQGIPNAHIREAARCWLDWPTFSNSNVKFFSHFGAIRLRQKNREAWSWIDPKTKFGYSDATNFVYGKVLEKFWPHLSRGLGLESQGDILEALFGYVFVLEDKMNTEVPLELVEFRDALDILVFHVWTQVYRES